MVLDPARLLRRNVHQNIPTHIMLEVVRYNTDFELAVEFFKMGYPLKHCMQGVPWPQVWTLVLELSTMKRFIEQFDATRIHGTS